MLGKVEGVSANTVRPRERSFVVEGKFSAGALVEGLQTARDNDRRFVLVATSKPVLAVLELARLDRVFTLVPSVAGASRAEVG